MKTITTWSLLLLFSLQAFALTPAERKMLFDESIQTLKATGIEEKLPAFGAVFPDVKISGKRVSEWTAQGPLLLVIYRGGWCPYCIRQLKDIQQNLGTFRKYGVTIVAIAPEKEVEVKKTKAKNGLEFALLSDLNGVLLREMGFLFRVDDKVAAEYRSFGIDLVSTQGNNNQELPIPATYLIGKDRKVEFAFVDANYRTRPDVTTVLSVAQELAAGKR